ncbi:unnamed protein product [Notodromas monacha]|uniref:Carboxylesterase type B domain-containing protein n=1 Tax=Notodromas monacha TaxID=399045 RepID=A0A7R9BWB9_9CRUS|nr:unnamed protein product [Notodromas monacha]CAG0921836.1 unnamed protein product [Notodromas monacha]
MLCDIIYNFASILLFATVISAVNRGTDDRLLYDYGVSTTTRRPVTPKVDPFEADDLARQELDAIYGPTGNYGRERRPFPGNMASQRDQIPFDSGHASVSRDRNPSEDGRSFQGGDENLNEQKPAVMNQTVLSRDRRPFEEDKFNRRPYEIDRDRRPYDIDRDRRPYERDRNIGPDLSYGRDNRYNPGYGSGLFGSNRNYPTSLRGSWNEFNVDPNRPYDSRTRNTFRQGATRYRAGRVRENDLGCPTCVQCGPISDWRSDLQGLCRESHAHGLDQSVTVKTGYGTIEPPRPHKGWQLWQATDFGPACPQPARHVGGAQNVWEMDEDCLYLNVYTPSVSGAVVNKYPVIVYIHGGQFEHGASNQFPPHALVAWHEVVVVTFNYRLGALGFLSTGDEHSPGNYGMLDQALAIRWVYENAHVFNGDPRRITLWGVGAGAAAAGLHVLTPRTKDKVFGVFAQSGSALADWAAIKLPEQARNTSRVYAARIACPNDNAFKLVDCLKKGRSFNELANQEIEPDLGLFTWAPVVDKKIKKPNWHTDQPPEDWSFLPDEPEILLDRREHRLAQYMTGLTRDEASHMLFENKTLAPSFEVGQQFMDEQIRKYVHKYNFTLNPGGVFDAIQSQYTFWPDPTNTTMIREEYINSEGNTSVHGVPIDSLFLAGAPFMDKEFFPESMRVDKRAWTEGDRNMSEFFMKAVANFAHHGKPTPEQILNINWEKALLGDLRYLNVNNTFNTSMLTNYRQQYFGFWTNLYWWEPTGPIQIAFWGASGAAILFMIIVGVCCCLWCSSRRALTKMRREFDDSVLYPCVEENYNAFATPSSIPATPLPPPSSTLALIPDSKEDLSSSQAVIMNPGKYAKNQQAVGYTKRSVANGKERPRSAVGMGNGSNSSSRPDVYSQYNTHLSKSSDELASGYHEKPMPVSKSSDRLVEYDSSRRPYPPQQQQQHNHHHQQPQQQQARPQTVKPVPPVVARKQQRMDEPDFRSAPPSATSTLLSRSNYDADTLPMSRRSYVVDDGVASGIGVPVLPSVAQRYTGSSKHGDTSASSLLSTNSSSKPYLESTC